MTELQKMPEGVEIKPKISKGGKNSKSKKKGFESVRLRRSHHSISLRIGGRFERSEYSRKRGS